MWLRVLKQMNQKGLRCLLEREDCVALPTEPNALLEFRRDKVGRHLAHLQDLARCGNTGEQRAAAISRSVVRLVVSDFTEGHSAWPVASRFCCPLTSCRKHVAQASALLTSRDACSLGTGWRGLGRSSLGSNGALGRRRLATTACARRGGWCLCSCHFGGDSVAARQERMAQNHQSNRARARSDSLNQQKRARQFFRKFFG